MDTIDEVVKNTEGRLNPAGAEPEQEIEIPEDYFKEVEDEVFSGAAAGEEADFDMFDIDFSDVEKAEKRESDRAARKAEQANKNRYTLIFRIFCIVLLPIVAINLFYILVSVSTTKKLTHDLLHNEMKALTISATETFSVYAPGDYSYADGVFYKGDTDMSPLYEYLDDMSEKAGVDVMIFFDDTCVMATHKDENGTRVFGEKMTSKVYKEVMAGNYYYNSDLAAQGSSYAVYYYPMMQESTGEVAGAIFCGVNRTGSDKSRNAVLAKLIWGGIIIAAAISVLAVFLIRKIAKVIKQNVGGLKGLAAGRLAVHIPESAVKRQDEIGDIARSVKKLVEELKGIVGSINRSTKSVSDFSDQIYASMNKIGATVDNVNIAVEEIAKGATSQAEETMEANNQVTEIGEVIQITVSEVDRLGVSAKRMDEYSIEADKTLQELLIISKEADDAINEIKRQTNETNESAQNIQKATDMIAGIASQTNLLSLNASIEAARAGEAGQGFAVVADEIRQLAEQSRASAEEIREIVEKLITNSNTSVKTMNGVSESINTQNDKLDETLKVFSELSSEVTSVMRAIKEISKQTKELGGLREGVVNIVEGLAAIAEENAASAQQTSASMYEVSAVLEDCRKQTEELTHLKEELTSNIAIFTLE